MPSRRWRGAAVAIALVLANGPRIILADEPTPPLDSQRAGIVMDLLRRIATEHDAALIVVTHGENLFSRFDWFSRLKDSRLVMPLVTSATSLHQASSEATTTATAG